MILTPKNITLIIPTYSYTNKGIFYVHKTPSHLSVLTKWVLQQKNIVRSEHPLFSLAGIGESKKILENVGKSAFGKNSIFNRLNNKKSCLIHLGRPLEYGNTVIHYVEQLCGADYRFNKKFKTKVFNKKKYIGTDYSVFVRSLKNPENDYVSNTIKIAKKLKKKKIAKEKGNYKELTNITFLDYSRAVDFMCNEFYKNQSIFIGKNKNEI